MIIQLNKYDTELYILQFFQSNKTVCFIIIHLFSESCDPEIVLNGDPNHYAGALLSTQLKTKTTS